jgi:hypothetical protein
MPEPAGLYLRAATDVVADPALMDSIQRGAAEQAATQAAREEALVRAALRVRFPRTGRWLGDHPRALRLLFRLRPGLRPTLIYEVGKQSAREVRWPTKVG